jgi:hypothetical protein
MSPHFTISPEATRKIINKMNSNIHPGKDGFSIDGMKQLIRANPVRQGIKSASDIFIEEKTTYYNGTILNLQYREKFHSTFQEDKGL